MRIESSMDTMVKSRKPGLLKISAGLFITAGAVLVVEAFGFLTVGQDPGWLTVPIVFLVAGIACLTLHLTWLWNRIWRYTLQIITIGLVLAPAVWWALTGMKILPQATAGYFISVPSAVVTPGYVLAIGRPDFRLARESASLQVDEIEGLVAAGRLDYLWDANGLLKSSDPAVAKWLSASCHVDRAPQADIISQVLGEWIGGNTRLAGKRTSSSPAVIQPINDWNQNSALYQCG